MLEPKLYSQAPSVCTKPGCEGTVFIPHEDGWQCFRCMKIIYKAYERVGSIERAYIRQAILGESEDIGKWVGCISPLPAANVLHEVKLGIGRDNNIHASVRLFARYGTPEYQVVVGPAL